MGQASYKLLGLECQCVAYAQWNKREILVRSGMSGATSLPIKEKNKERWGRHACDMLETTPISLGILLNHGGNANENVTWKWSYLHYVVSIPIRSTCTVWTNYPVTKLVGTENEQFTVMCLRSPKSLEFGHFTLLFDRVRLTKINCNALHSHSFVH